MLALPTVRETGKIKSKRKNQAPFYVEAFQKIIIFMLIKTTFNLRNTEILSRELYKSDFYRYSPVGLTTMKIAILISK